MRLLRKLKRLFRRDILRSDFDHVFLSDMPDGHLSCGCGCPFFWVVLAGGERRIYAVCSNCERQLTLHFLPETDLTDLGEGEAHCERHPKSQFVLIKSGEHFSCGCRNCNTEVNIRIYRSHIVEDAGSIIQ